MNPEDKLKEILSLVKLCPENLQDKCFELLFNHYFANSKPLIKSEKNTDEQPDAESEKQEPESESIQLRDLHAKVKAFVTKGEITVEQINNLFYKEDGEIKPLYDDLKTTKMSDAQIRLTLLGALENSLTTGDFSIKIEKVRKMCDVHKCYDLSNFTANFKKAKALFTEEYKKGLTTFTLSAEGKKQALGVAVELIS